MAIGAASSPYKNKPDGKRRPARQVRDTLSQRFTQNVDSVYAKRGLDRKPYHPFENCPLKPLRRNGFEGLFVNTSPPFPPHVFPLLFSVSRFAADWGTVAPPAVCRNGPPAHRATGGAGGASGQGGLQRRIKGQHSLPEIAAISPCPAFAEHIAITLQRQTPVFPVIVGAPFYHQRPDRRPFLPR